MVGAWLVIADNVILLVCPVNMHILKSFQVTSLDSIIVQLPLEPNKTIKGFMKLL